MSRPPAKPLLVAFALAAVAELVCVAVGSRTGQLVAKPLLMPLLAAYVAARGGPRLLVAALLLGWGGDVLLLVPADAAFLAGMGCFAAGHLCYLTLFGRRRTRVDLAVGYGLVLVVALVLLWPGLPAELRVPVAVYSLLLAAMAYRASGLGPLAGAGGALFLLSDTLIATDVAEWPQPPAAGLWIMLTYLAAQALLTAGVVHAGTGLSPTEGSPAARTARPVHD
ncbi:lysoplasmalogenase [Streptomyces sp. NBC_01716]|uniref:lysoplasmalogenase n=1 Tax=Streptomyces sp. NBC_01716 TaxID=2975917 RepID=UPI002E30FBEC|nr:lysoplasmalogenase [Streptomyces sp. NBC_01716]